MQSVCTVRELRKLISTVPEINEDGSEVRVFMACGNLQTSPLESATLDEDGDLLLVPEFWQAVMQDLGSWEDFIE
jgi:hypothetical protein